MLLVLIMRLYGWRVARTVAAVTVAAVMAGCAPGHGGAWATMTYVPGARPSAPVSQQGSQAQPDAAADTPVTFRGSEPANPVPSGSASGAGSVTAPSAPAATGSATPAGVPGTGAAAVAPTAVLPVHPAAPAASAPAGSGPASSGSAPAGNGPASSGSAPFTFGFWPHDNRTFDAPVINALGAKPAIVNYYSAWRAPFSAQFAQDARADGITTFVELEPWNCASCAGGRVPSLTSIAAGDYDAYLTSFGQEIERFGHPVLATFAHEMNGGWYPWGRGGTEHVTPAQWVAAWDRVVTVVSAAAPGLVEWVWAPEAEPGVGPVAPYWPGARYVDLVGIDGYLSTDTDTYGSVFGQTVADIRILTSLPIWIAETGIKPGPARAARLAAYVAAVRASIVTGFLYFNEHSWTLAPAEVTALTDAISARPR